MTEKLTAAVFSAHLNETFQINFTEDASIAAQLIEVSEQNNPQNTKKNKSFSILFRCLPNQLFAQGTYTLNHPEIGEMKLFLVPIGPDDQGMCYEAVFNYRLE